ncbi:hypothetical protein A5819_003549 [Enterococcus sp. 7E2_DIV0204]|uniref:AbiU2 domain-containing protein n=2 Tax=Enterococcus TaxID=1350 RepID=UPI000A341BD1|nr:MULTISPECIES: hypothetical protein [unclassified Enterococcus]OTN83999.1 hypothetical protein A5819_003549 [Enterococcus sp. 7E2_DIV0204]OTP47218.1 hypothetical protein A5884_003593 [Enterococcus sp. 7D2_DIV0200]
MNIDEITERNEFLLREGIYIKKYLNSMQAIIDLKSKNYNDFKKAWKFFNSSYDCLRFTYISTICRSYDKNGKYNIYKHLNTAINHAKKINDHYVAITDNEFIDLNKITFKSVKEQLNSFKNELESLLPKVEEIKKYRDKVIAHNDMHISENSQNVIGNFTYKDLYNLSDYVFRVTNYLKLLLENKSISIEDSIQCDLNLLFE